MFSVKKTHDDRGRVQRLTGSRVPPRKPNCCVSALTQDGGCRTDGVRSQQGRGPHGFRQPPPQNLPCRRPGTPFQDIRRVSAFDVKRNESSSLEGGL